MPIQLCENFTPVTIFGKFCVILTFLKKSGTKGGGIALERNHTQSGAGRPADCDSDTWK
jgi:hypothetical protein